MTDKDYRLCFVKNNVMYFTDDFENCTGDDFNDRPYDCNAGEPYEWVDEWSAEENKKHGHTHIRYISYMPYNYWIREPKDGHWTNCPFSVDDINAGAIAWLFCDEAGALPAGATIEEAITWLKSIGAKWGELHE